MRRTSVASSDRTTPTTTSCSLARMVARSIQSTSPTPSSAESPATGCPASAYVLRHTWATLALQAGVDVKIVSERLGHASAKITWDIYQHVTPTMQADASETVARLIFGTPGLPG